MQDVPEGFDPKVWIAEALNTTDTKNGFSKVQQKRTLLPPPSNQSLDHLAP